MVAADDGGSSCLGLVGHAAILEKVALFATLTTTYNRLSAPAGRSAVGTKENTRARWRLQSAGRRRQGNMMDAPSAAIMSQDEPSSLRKEIGISAKRAKRKARFNYFFAYTFLLTGVISSVAASILVASGSVCRVVVAILAAIPGAVVVLTSTFQFEERANWWYNRARALDVLRRQLDYEGYKTAEISKALTQIVANSEESWPSFGKAISGRLPADTNKIDH